MAKKEMKDETKASASVTEDILDDAEPIQQTVASTINENVIDDDANNLRSSASEWLGNCFSTLGKKTKK